MTFFIMEAVVLYLLSENLRATALLDFLHGLLVSLSDNVPIGLQITPPCQNYHPGRRHSSFQNKFPEDVSAWAWLNIESMFAHKGG